MVTAPVAAETPIPDPAIAEVTPVLVIVIVSGFEATDVIPVPSAIINVSPLLIVSVVPLEPSTSKVNDHAGLAQVLSPLKNVEAEAVPVADRSAVTVSVAATV